MAQYIPEDELWSSALGQWVGVTSEKKSFRHLH